MGEVYIARTRHPDRPVVAIKRLRGDVARVPTFAERFEHEAQLAVRLAHPNVVATIDVGTVGTVLYVASELVLGKDTGVIADRLRERGQGAPVAVVVRILLDVLQGLAYVHSARERDGRWLALVHRDVTPGNVLVSYEGVARMADFGLAKSQLTDKSNLTSHGEILGTPHYMAPELVRGAKASPSSDLYGLGAVTYRILTGLAPFTGSTTEVLMKVLNERPRPLTEWRPDLPQWFAGIVHELLDPDPKRRPFDAGLLARRLEHEAEGARLLLPHASVGRWLSQLFEEEKAREIDEYEAIAALSPPATDPDDDTRVLAAIEAGRGLEGGSTLAQGDDAGTELELSSAMFLDLSREARRQRSELANDTGPLDPAERRLPEWRETADAAEGTPRTPVPPTTDRDERDERDERTRESGSLTLGDPDDRTTEDPGQAARMLPGFANDRRARPVIAHIETSAAGEEIATAVTDLELRKILEAGDPDDRTAVRAPDATLVKPRADEVRTRLDGSSVGRLVDDPASHEAIRPPEVRRLDERLPEARGRPDGGRLDGGRSDAARVEPVTDRSPRAEDRSTARGEERLIAGRIDERVSGRSEGRGEDRIGRGEDRLVGRGADGRADDRMAARSLGGDERGPVREERTSRAEEPPAARTLPMRSEPLRTDVPRSELARGEIARGEDQRVLRTEDVRVGRIAEEARALDPARTPARPASVAPPIEATRPLTRRPPATTGSGGRGRRWITALAAVLVTASVTAGVVLVLARSPSAAEQAASARFGALSARVTSAAQKGEVVDARAIALVGEAASALVEHDVPRAEAALDQLEAALAAPRVQQK